MTHTTTHPALPLKNIVVYPHIVQHLAVGRRASMAALKRSTERVVDLVTVAQRAANVENPTIDDLHPVGTLVQIKRIESHDQGAQVIVQGERRIRILSAVPDEECLMLEVEPLPVLSMTADLPADSADRAAAEALLRENLALAQAIARLMDSENGDQIYQQLIGTLPDPVVQMYRIANLANLTVEQQQEVLAADDVRTLMQVASEEMDTGELVVLIAEGTYTSLLKFVDFRIFIDRDYHQTLEARKKRARDKFDAFMMDVLEREHQIISQHKSMADAVVSPDFDEVKLR